MAESRLADLKLAGCRRQSELNPLIVQFWLWGADANRGDLKARGFVQLGHPEGIKTKSSVYQLGQFWLHANALWLEDERLLYHRGQEKFSRSSEAYFVPEPPSLEAIVFDAGLERLRSLVLEHERFILERHGPHDRLALLEAGAPFGVRRAWDAWTAWLELDRPQIPAAQIPPVMTQDQLGSFA